MDKMVPDNESRDRVEPKLSSSDRLREMKWAESIAVGSKSFIEATIKKAWD